MWRDWGRMRHLGYCETSEGSPGGPSAPRADAGLPGSHCAGPWGPPHLGGPQDSHSPCRAWLSGPGRMVEYSHLFPTLARGSASHPRGPLIGCRAGLGFAGCETGPGALVQSNSASSGCVAATKQEAWGPVSGKEPDSDLGALCRPTDCHSILWFPGASVYVPPPPLWLLKYICFSIRES